MADSYKYNWTERVSSNAPGVTYIVPEPEPEGARVWFLVVGPSRMIESRNGYSSHHLLPLRQ